MTSRTFLERGAATRSAEEGQKISTRNSEESLSRPSRLAIAQYLVRVGWPPQTATPYTVANAGK